jgi:hypothetical protein
VGIPRVQQVIRFAIVDRPLEKFVGSRSAAQRFTPDWVHASPFWLMDPTAQSVISSTRLPPLAL